MLVKGAPVIDFSHILDNKVYFIGTKTFRAKPELFNNLVNEGQQVTPVFLILQTQANRKNSKRTTVLGGVSKTSMSS